MPIQGIPRGFGCASRAPAWRVLCLYLIGLCFLGLSSMAGAEAPMAGAEAPAAAQGSGCAEDAGRDTARRVQARYEAIRDLEADFEQQTQSAIFGGEALSEADPKTGRVVFAKPGRMRWTYVAPEPSVVVSNGRDLWIHDVEGGTATRLAVTQGYLTGAALQFLLGDGNILESFRVEALACEPTRVTLDLVPLNEASYERLGLVANPETGDIESSSVVDLFGNRTEIRFRRVQVNLEPPVETFEFEVPEGVEVIDYAAGGGEPG
jgi:outer membrane lipoprotein carrier protein